MKPRRFERATILSMVTTSGIPWDAIDGGQAARRPTFCSCHTLSGGGWFGDVPAVVCRQRVDAAGELAGANTEQAADARLAPRQRVGQHERGLDHEMTGEQGRAADLASLHRGPGEESAARPRAAPRQPRANRPYAPGRVDPGRLLIGPRPGLPRTRARSDPAMARERRSGRLAGRCRRAAPAASPTAPRTAGRSRCPHRARAMSRAIAEQRRQRQAAGRHTDAANGRDSIADEWHPGCREPVGVPTDAGQRQRDMWLGCVGDQCRN